MDTIVINGGKKLVGEVDIFGSKNACVALIPATILCADICKIENVPDIKDVNIMLKAMETIGVKVKRLSHDVIEIDSREINTHVVAYEMVREIRASYYLIGALIGRMRKASVPLPGGCNFGERPIDQHIKGFESMGININISHGIVNADAQVLKGSQIYLDVVTVGATINIMLAGVYAEGLTVIENAAKEPHIVDLANFLNFMGADIKGAGTDIIKIRGVKKLKGCTYSVIPDQIEAGTFMIAAAATGGDVLIKNVIPKHLESITAKLIEIGVNVKEYDDSIRIRREKPLAKANVKTLPHPGFPTDLQPQIVTLLSMARGTSMVSEGIWDSRFQYVDELRRMGANILVTGRTAIIEGTTELQGSPVRANDLRAGAGLVIAGLMAQGETIISNVKYIDRGYEHLEIKLQALGADIVRKKVIQED